MNQHHSPLPRPEDRRRAGGALCEWSDTLPQCWRSEGFAEDLSAAAEPPIQRHKGAAGAATAATLPLLGAGMAALLGLLAR